MSEIKAKVWIKEIPTVLYKYVEWNVHDCVNNMIKLLTNKLNTSSLKIEKIVKLVQKVDQLILINNNILQI